MFRIWNELQKSTNIPISKWNKRARFYLNPTRSRRTFVFGRKWRSKTSIFCWEKFPCVESALQTAVDHSPTFEVGNSPSTTTVSVSDSSSTSQHSQKENPWERRKMWEEEETIDKPGMATNYFFHVGFLKIMWKWLGVCSLSALPRLSLRHINGFLSWPCALQGPLTRFVRYLHNFRDAWTPSGVSH